MKQNNNNKLNGDIDAGETLPGRYASHHRERSLKKENQGAVLMM